MASSNPMSLARYEHDYFQWLVNQVDLLRTGQVHELDLNHLAEEIEDLGKSERRALISDLTVVLMHLLKWQFQPERRGNSWRYSILEHRRRIYKRLTESHSLKPYLTEGFEDAYQDARIAAAKETELNLDTFPEDSPFTLDATLDIEFLPLS
jgi:Domain of unknown function DUF29